VEFEGFLLVEMVSFGHVISRGLARGSVGLMFLGLCLLMINLTFVSCVL